MIIGRAAELLWQISGMPVEEMLRTYWHATEGHASRLTIVSGCVLRRDDGPGVLVQLSSPDRVS